MMSQVGVAILNRKSQPVFYNSEAYQIVAYAVSRKCLPDVEHLAMQELQTIAQATIKNSPYEYLSGRRKYLIHLIRAENERAGYKGSVDASAASTVLLMERSAHSKFERIDRISEKYDLTGRERQAITLLCHGLTSKQIAQRMSISPNTVKVFLRLVMLKMNVSTRSAILGKLVDTSTSVSS